jgi:mono/diheme cytochrome c family protein
MLATWALALAVILQLLLVHMVITLQGEMTDQRNTLATKADLENLAVNMGPANPAMSVLQADCTQCHTADRIAAAHALEEDASQVVQKMVGLKDSFIDPMAVPKLTAALTYVKCAHCHSADRLKEMAILDPAARWEVIHRMAEEAGSTITPEDARRIRDFYGEFWGWHTP